MKSLFDYQKQYVRQLIDVTHGYGNVIYALMNEPPEGAMPDGENAKAFAYFSDYWAWFVKDHLARQYAVTRLVSQDVRDGALDSPNTNVIDARWGDHDPGISEPQFLSDVLGFVTASIRGSYLSNAKATTLDEFGNSETDPARLRKAAWSIVMSGGHLHIEDPCNPEFRTCTNPPDEEDGVLDPSQNARPWDPIRSLEAFKATSGWRFDRARPAYRSDLPAGRWFYWMVQGDPEYDKVGFAGSGILDHIGYLAHRSEEACTGAPLESELPAMPSGADEYVARLWDPAGTAYVEDRSHRVLEYRFSWPGGAIDWCQTPFVGRILSSDDLVFHVRAGRPGSMALRAFGATTKTAGATKSTGTTDADDTKAVGATSTTFD